MPYLNRLADQNGLATQCYANTHPSIGNYFMLTAGQIITNDDSFTGTVSANNLVRILNANGKSWKSYAESLPSTGYLGGDIFPYIKRHNPFAFFSDVLTTAQASRIVPSWQLANDISSGQLPQFAFVAPNAEHDGHDCPGGGDSCSDDVKLGAVDTWLQQNIGPLLSNSEFQQNGLLIVVFDEADDSDSAGGGGHIAMVVVSGKAKVGYRSTTRYQHQSTLRLILQAIGLTELPGAAASAPDMSEFF